MTCSQVANKIRFHFFRIAKLVTYFMRAGKRLNEEGNRGINLSLSRKWIIVSGIAKIITKIAEDGRFD